MQEFYLRDYDVNLKFPDGMSEEKIKGIIKRDYPEPNEKLVARFENPDTPAASLSKEDHERYLQARPDMTAGRFAGMAADAFLSTAGRLLTNLPEFLTTFANPMEMGVSARTLAEGFARGTYDTETMGRMAEGYLMSKVEGFGGRTNDEKENQYRRFLKVKELQNVRSKIDRGDKSAWNEYMEYAGANGAKIDPEKFNQGAAEFLGEFADPSLLIPGSKIGTAIAKTTGRVTGGAVSAAGDMMSAGGRRLSDLRSSATDAVGNLASKVDEASGGIGRYAVPTGVGTAIGVGALDLGTAGMGTLAVAGIPAAMEVAGGLLRNFGDAMKVNPTRSGGLARMALNSPDTAAGYLAGKLKFLDTPVNYAGRAASGAVTGVGVGAGIGLATGGVEGVAQGIGSGGAMGAFGGTMGRFVEGATGAAKRAAQDSDLAKWLEDKSDEDRASLGRYKNRDDLIRAMDLEQVILGSTSEAEPIIRYGTDETVIGQDAQGKDITLKGGGGAYTQEGGRPVIHLNTNSDLRTLAHETFHAIARIDGFEVMVQRIKDQVGKLYKDQEIDKLINDYEKSGKLLVTDDTPGKSDRDKKFNSILEEIGAEYFANYIKGKDSNYLFKGNPIREAIRGITDRFVAGKLDRVHNTFKSDIFDTPIKQSKALNRSIDDLVRARRRSKRNINLSVDTPVRVYSDFDLKDDAIFQELVDMGAARVTATGKREMIKTDYQVKKIEAERAKTMAKVLDSVDDTGGLIRDERGNYSGLRFSRKQIDALLASDAITGTLRKALEKINEMPDDSGLMNVLYAAATAKTKKGSRYRNLPLSNRDAILYNFIVSPETGTMRVKVADKTLLDQRVAKEFANPETQKEFSNIEEMQRDLLTYLDALSSGQTPTAEVLGSAKKRDILNKVLRVRNQKNNILVPEGTKFNEVEKNFPWRDFRLDRIVQMQARETKVNFSEDAYNRAGVNFRPRTFEPGQTTVLKPSDLARFSPSPDNPNLDLRDLNNKKIQVLTTDSSGARDRNANGVAVQFRGGPGHLALYDGWGFTNINSAKAFITRLRRDGFPLVGITSMKPNNHLNSKLARRYYGLKWEELVETGKVTEREANKHIKEAMKRIINSKAGKSPLTKQQMSIIAGIKTYKDFARVFEEIPWKAAPVLYTKLDGKTLPIKQSRLKELGMDLETVANELREPAYEGIGPGTLLAIAEYGGKPPEYRPELNENYPYFVGLKEKAFLKEFTEVTNLTSRKDVATKSGKPNSAVLMGAGVVLDKLASGEVRFSPSQQQTPEFKSWFDGSKVTDESGKPLVTYSGHGNVAMFGNKWQAGKATSGGFYFSEDPKIASSYAMGKMGNREYYEGGEEYRLLDKKGNPSKRLDSRDLTPAEQKRASRYLTKHAGQDPVKYWEENARYDAKASRALMSGGMRRLSNIHDFLEMMGETIAYDDYDPTGKLPRAFKQTKNTFEGMLDDLGIKWNSSQRSQPGVYPVYLSIKNPLDASKPFPQTVLRDLQKAAKRERVPKWKERENTQWTKDMPLAEFVEGIESGNEYWTTQVPTKAKKIFKDHGIDGIKELGMKGAEDGVRRQTNWIAFEPSQIKSATGNRGSFDPNKADIRFSPERMESLPSGEGPVLPKVEPPILQGPSANVVSLAKVKAEISKEKSPKVVDNTEIQEDMPVGLRLDIPTYERTIKAGQPVFPVAVHEKWKGKQAGKAGKVIGYTNIAAVKNPVFTVNEKAAESIKGGKAKSTIATVEGLYSKTREIPGDINTWTQVGMNPRRHSYFYDRETGQPVIGGDVAISSGNTVFVKNPTYDSPGRFRFSPQRELNKRGGAIYTNERGDRAVQTSSRAGVRVYSTQGKRIGPVFRSIEKAERHLAKMGK